MRKNQKRNESETIIIAHEIGPEKEALTHFIGLFSRKEAEQELSNLLEDILWRDKHADEYLVDKCIYKFVLTHKKTGRVCYKYTIFNADSISN
jgi:hypothetical protein